MLQFSDRLHKVRQALLLDHFSMSPESYAAAGCVLRSRKHKKLPSNIGDSGLDAVMSAIATTFTADFKNGKQWR